MDKLLTAAIMALLVFTSPAFAIGKDTMFASFELGEGDTSVETELIWSDSTKPPEKAVKGKNYTLAQLGVRVGFFYDYNVRIYASLNQSQKRSMYTVGETENDVKFINNQVIASADYVFDVGHFIRPYVGASFGINQSQFELRGGYAEIERDYSKSKAKHSFAYGFQMGLLRELGLYTVELGYRYLNYTTKVDHNILKGEGARFDAQLKALSSTAFYLSASRSF